jgi:hypothetical protein
VEDERNVNVETNNVGTADILVVARVSVHVLREERAYHICKNLAESLDLKDTPSPSLSTD